MKQEQLKQWAHFFLTYKFALDEVETKLNILNEEFQFIHDYNPIEHVKTRIKTPESVMEKLRRKNLDISIEHAKTHIRDIAGVRVICSFSTDIYQILNMISEQSDVKVIEVKDYVKDPKPNGYKSVHLIAEIPVFLTNRIENVLVEIQIRTSAMDFWASLEHKIFYKFNEGIPAEIQQQLKESADMIDLLDQRMLSINDKVLHHLQLTAAK
ncbi:GTP pyrophosphokinase family protein [Paenibacillus sp. NEAU-GSW1]|uniref:GTP pyrophosphokinase n=1 Tax=Paenibacillus sp. NEAU-GSW1 TaxID=2682486 RepID=UPI0012E1A72C|nr:GTP pyrophosphokinase family protein [Paenibacillus sp. NEAU-GSW1]MUT66697.1 GTP pyrophosphokinase family protein [Paenibacillus sp. NEAU-GSW1]